MASIDEHESIPYVFSKRIVTNTLIQIKKIRKELIFFIYPIRFYSPFRFSVTYITVNKTSKFSSKLLKPYYYKNQLISIRSL